MFNMVTLTIRAKQMGALDQAGTEQFIRRAIDHIRVSLPEIYSGEGQDAVRASALQALAKANEFAIEEQFDVIRYLNLMYILGFEFDEDPSYPWARETLLAKQFTPREKLDLLTQLALQEAGAFAD